MAKSPSCSSFLAKIGFTPDHLAHNLGSSRGRVSLNLWSPLVNFLFLWMKSCYYSWYLNRWQQRLAVLLWCNLSWRLMNKFNTTYMHYTPYQIFTNKNISQCDSCFFKIINLDTCWKVKIVQAWTLYIRSKKLYIILLTKLGFRLHQRV